MVIAFLNTFVLNINVNFVKCNYNFFVTVDHASIPCMCTTTKLQLEMKNWDQNFTYTIIAFTVVADQTTVAVVLDNPLFNIFANIF